MIQDFLKDKKKIGIAALLFIIIVIIGITYLRSGFKELKKNDTESIFVDNTENTDTVVDKKNSSSSSKNNSNKNNNDKKNSEEAVIKDKNIVVEIKGEVKKPDVYILDDNSIIKDLIEAAGGLTENADLSNINRAKKLQDHELVYVASKNEVASTAQSINQNSGNKDSLNQKVNINNATLEELKTIKGVGDAKAKSIIEYREKNGGFKNIEDIKNITGIGEKMFEKIKDKIEIWKLNYY